MDSLVLAVRIMDPIKGLVPLAKDFDNGTNKVTWCGTNDSMDRGCINAIEVEVLWSLVNLTVDEVEHDVLVNVFDGLDVGYDDLHLDY